MTIISIFGGGISGLTIAHELIEKGFKVHIYELTDSIGGMAKSIRIPSNNIPTEHAWRGYWPFYKNCFNILKRIPATNINIEKFSQSYSIEEISKHNSKEDLWVYFKGNVYNVTNFINEHPGGYIILKAGGKNLEEVWKDNNVAWHLSNKIVQDQLSKYQIGTVKESFKNEFTVFNNLSHDIVNMKLLQNNDSDDEIEISDQDYPYLTYLFLTVVLSDNRRNKMFETPFLPLIKDKVTKETYDYLTYFVCSTGLGINITLTSLAHYGLFVNFQFMFASPFNPNVQVMNQPTSEAWFNFWQKYLENRGVNFYFNSKLNKIIHDDQKVIKCIVNNKEVISDEYCFCLNPYDMIDILKESNLPKLYEQHLYLKTIDNQIGFVIAFNKKIKVPHDNNGIVIIDSPYNIAFYSQDKVWGKNVFLGNNVKSLWSGTCILPINNGSLYGKPATQLTREQCMEEIIYQLFECKQLQEMIKDCNDDLLLTNDLILFSTLYDDWQWDGKELSAKHKKWVNTYFNEAYRPQSKTNLLNMYIGGAHCKTSINIWTMESAVESGKIVSNDILTKYNLPLAYQYTQHNNLLIVFIQKLDNILYAMKLPNIIKTTVFIILLKLALKYCKK
jgi:uncharacterized protein with NAD-binding domain and iron-sulfur cluster